MSEFCEIKDWNVFPADEKPYIIAGPCSVESREQFFDVASALKEMGVSVIRGGIWKPRTHPNCFEGVGAEGLGWMREVGDTLGVKIATEVANVRHVEAALKVGIDLIWVGARTVGDPIALQELADALKGVEIPVLIKNPLVPDPELWAGGIERLLSAGLVKIAAIHRGFHSYEKSMYRNAPIWQIPVEMERRFHGLPMFCDPSHISGDRALVDGLSRMAVAFGFDGLMIEVHTAPDKALSDSAQQVTPEMFSTILDNIRSRKKMSVAREDLLKEMDELRTDVDRIDSCIIDLISDRMETVGKIGKLKSELDMAVLQPARWEKVLERAMAQAGSKGVDAALIKKIFSLLHEASMENQVEN